MFPEHVDSLSGTLEANRMTRQSATRCAKLNGLAERVTRSVPKESRSGKLTVLMRVDSNSAVACGIMRWGETQWVGPKEVGSLADAAI